MVGFHPPQFVAGEARYMHPHAHIISKDCNGSKKLNKQAISVVSKSQAGQQVLCIKKVSGLILRLAHRHSYQKSSSSSR